MCTLLYLKWITNKKNLLYSTWHSAQILCASLDERGLWGRMDTRICMAESLHCSPETITILLIVYTPIQNVFGVKKIIIKFNLKKEGDLNEYMFCWGLLWCPVLGGTILMSCRKGGPLWSPATGQPSAIAQHQCQKGCSIYQCLFPHATFSILFAFATLLGIKK